MQLTEEQRQAIRDSVHSSFAGHYADELAPDELAPDELAQDIISRLECVGKPAEPQIWRPEDGEAYHFVDYDGAVHIENCCMALIDKVDVGLLANFNAFQTREQAETVAKWQRAYRKLYMIWLAIDGRPADRDEQVAKWHIYKRGGRWIATNSYLAWPVITFSTKELAERAIEMMGYDIEHLLL